MKKLIASISGLVCLAGICYSFGAAQADTAATAPAAAAIPHKVGLIDLAAVYNKYKKFDLLKEDLKGEIQQTEAKGKELSDKLAALQAELRSGTYKEGSPEFTQKEKELTQGATEFESFRKIAQREISRKESKIYQQTYLEISDFVEKYATHFKYTLILRFNRDEPTSADPQKMLQSLNRTVVYSRPSEDITDDVIDFMNQSYDKNVSKKSTKSNVERTGGEKSVPAGGAIRKTAAPR